MRELLVQILGIAQTTPSTLLPCEEVSSPLSGNIPPVELLEVSLVGESPRFRHLDFTDTTERILGMCKKATKIKLNRNKTLGNNSC